MVIRSLFFCCLLFLSNCGNDRPAELPQPETPSFFDLAAFFNNEVQRLNDSAVKTRKVVRVNDQTEEKIEEQVKFDQELRAFINSDINRVAWMDKYAVDSTVQGRQLTELSYTALDDKLRTRLLEIKFQDGEVKEIAIQNQLNTAIAKTQQQLFYLPKKGYRIRSTQEIRLSEDQELEVEVIFLD